MVFQHLTKARVYLGVFESEQSARSRFLTESPVHCASRRATTCSCASSAGVWK